MTVSQPFWRGTPWLDVVISVKGAQRFGLSHAYINNNDLAHADFVVCKTAGKLRWIQFENANWKTGDPNRQCLRYRARPYYSSTYDVAMKAAWKLLAYRYQKLIFE